MEKSNLLLTYLALLLLLLSVAAFFIVRQVLKTRRFGGNAVAATVETLQRKGHRPGILRTGQPAARQKALHPGGPLSPAGPEKYAEGRSRQCSYGL